MALRSRLRHAPVARPRIKRPTLGSCLGIAVAVMLIVLLWPANLGGKTGFVTVQGTSMQPMLHTGDLVFVRKSDSYRVGELVAFRLNGGEVIHRLHSGNSTEGFETKGDNRTTPDPWTIHNDNIVGREWFVIPKVGRYYTFLHRPLVLFVVLFSLIMFEGARSEQKKRRTHRHGKRHREPAL